MEAQALEHLLRDVGDWPAKVHHWYVEKGEDATGDAAVWVWITLSDVMKNREIRDRFREQVRTKLVELEGRDTWVYVRFRDVTELEEA